MTKAPSITEVDGKKFNEWLKDMTHEDPSVREQAIRAIVYFPGPHGGELITALLNRCQDADTSVRVRAVMALTVLDVREEEVTRIVKAMNSRLTRMGAFPTAEPQVIVRFHAAVCLLRFGEKAHDAVTTLIEGTKDPGSFETRRMCVRALESCGYLTGPMPPGAERHAAPDPKVTKALHACLRASSEPTASVHLEAVIALGSMGKSADPELQKDTEKLLLAMLGHHDKSVVIWSLVSLVALDWKGEPTDRIVGKLVPFLKAPEQRYRLQAIQALGIVHFRSKIVVDLLIGLLEDKDPVIVNATMITLAGLGKDAMPAIKALTAISMRKSTDVEKALAATAEAAIKYIQAAK
jgi:HEAT repeat protein